MPSTYHTDLVVRVHGPDAVRTCWRRMRLPFPPGVGMVLDNTPDGDDGYGPPFHGFRVDRVRYDVAVATVTLTMEDDTSGSYKPDIHAMVARTRFGEWQAMGFAERRG